MPAIRSRSQKPRDQSPDDQLPHWSETAPATPRPRPSRVVASYLRDLVAWASDLAITLTRGTPEDRAAINRVRDYAYAWLAGQDCAELHVDVRDLVTTLAALMAEFDRVVGGTAPDLEERPAIAATASA